MSEKNELALQEPKNTEITPNDEKLAVALNTADTLIRMKYLSELDKMEIVPLSKKEMAIAPESKVRLYHIGCLTYDEKESISDKLSGVFNSIAGYDATAVFLLRHDGTKTDLYMGTACDDPQKVQLASRTFSRALSGNFPGCISESKTESEVKELLDEVMDYGSDDPLAVASISSIASTRGDGETYLQGMEKLVDGMNGVPFNLVILASALSPQTISSVKNGYENLYTELVPFHKMSASLSDTDSESFSRAIGESVSQTVTKSQGTSENQSDTTGMSRTLTRTKQDEKSKKDKAVDIFAAVAGVAGSIAGAVVGTAFEQPFVGSSIGSNIGGTIGKAAQTMIQSPGGSSSEGTSDNSSISISKGKNYNESEAKGKTDTTTDTMGDTHSTGRTMQYSMENRTVGSLLSSIDVHIDRLTACEGNGAFQCAAYLMAADQPAAVMGASLYRSLLTGSSPEASVSYVNVWQDHDDTRKLCDYFKHMKHPRFSSGNELLGEVTATTTTSSMELPLHFAWPRKSLPGLMVASHAEFSRDIIKRSEDDKGVEIGNITHMGSVSDTKVSLSLGELRKHTFIAGQPGSGKSNFCYVLLDRLSKQGVHFLVVEPAKGEYSTVFGGREDVNVYGTNSKYAPLLSINPFAFPDGIDVLEHMDRIIEVFNASWPMYAAMPAILKDALEQVYVECGWDLLSSTCSYYPPKFPTFTDLLNILPRVIREAAYSEEVTSNYVGSLVTRVKSMTNGICGQIFCSEEIDNKKLFDENTIIDISRIGSGETKALIMGILIIRLQEHRSCNRDGINQELKHVTLLEEAHHLLRATSGAQSMESANVRGMSVEILTNAIAEMRTYGEGFIIADQTPSIMSEAVISNTGSKIIFRLPNIRDRTPVSEAVSLNSSQVEEIARLDTGVAVVHQSGWLSPVLCKIDLFPPESYCPLDYHPTEVPKEFLLRARGIFFELLLSKNMKTDPPSEQFCLDAIRFLGMSLYQSDKKMASLIKGYLGSGSMDAWSSFDELCRVVKDTLNTDKLFTPFPSDPVEWDKKAREYLSGCLDASGNTVDTLLATLIMSRNATNPRAKQFFFKWRSREKSSD
ncbi:MAG: DUF87 domain-containing protein [Oscillospiraceae bacterium]|nr:DUF87 domain-containing protein [Oscillospiraceae bacterium]